MVAFEPIVSVVEAEPFHISRLPFVADGFTLCRSSMPFIVKSLLAVMPPAPLIVKLFTFPIKMEEGSIIATGLVKTKVEEVFPASINPLEIPFVGELPEIVNVFEPIVSVPDCNSNNPFMVIS